MLLTGETQGYYGDYQRVATARHRPRARAPALSIRAKRPRFAAGNLRGEPSGKLAPPPSSISCRTTTRSATARSATGSKASPTPRRSKPRWRLPCWRRMMPMLFMGEEWGSKAPFPFFCDFQGDLAEAVRKGRRREYRLGLCEIWRRNSRPACDTSTFQSAVLDWDARKSPAGQRRLALVQDLLAIRRREIVPRLAGATLWRCARGGQRPADGATGAWAMAPRCSLTANLSDRRDRPRSKREPAGTPIWGGESTADPAMVGVLAHRRAIMPPAIPIATYRVQLTANFDFDAAAAIVPYLKALGITHLYASPFMKARKGSTHGYDIVDHTRINPELGGDAGFERLSDALKQHDLGLILDFVPNHVGVHFADNPWWLDVLEWGPASPHAVSFDIDWDMLPYRARGGVLLPIIGSSYGEALEKGEIELRYDPGEGSFSAWYFEHRLPIAPERYSEILRSVVKEAGAEDERGGQAPSRSRLALRGIAPSQPQGSARLQGGARRHRRRRRHHRARARRLSRRHRIAPRRSWRCIICWNASTTSSATGGWPPATSTIGAFSTSIRWPDCGSRMPALSTPFISLVKKLIAEGQAAGPAARSHRRLARSRAIFPAPAPPDPGCTGKGCQAVLHGDRKNSRRT